MVRFHHAPRGSGRSEERCEWAPRDNDGLTSGGQALLVGPYVRLIKHHLRDIGLAQVSLEIGLRSQMWIKNHSHSSILSDQIASVNSQALVLDQIVGLTGFVLVRSNVDPHGWSWKIIDQASAWAPDDYRFKAGTGGRIGSHGRLVPPQPSPCVSVAKARSHAYALRGAMSYSAGACPQIRSHRARSGARRQRHVWGSFRFPRFNLTVQELHGDSFCLSRCPE